MTTYVDITEDEFDDLFQPETNPDGSIYRQRDWTVPEDWSAIQAAAAEGRAWTMTDDGISHGVHVVNRQYYIITQYAPAEDVEYIIEMDPLFYPTEEEESC